MDSEMCPRRGGADRDSAALCPRQKGAERDGVALRFRQKGQKGTVLPYVLAKRDRKGQCAGLGRGSQMPPRDETHVKTH